MSLLIRTLRKEIDELHEKGIKLSLIGEIDQLPNSVQKPLHHAVELTQENQKANLIIALNYGSKAEILRATKNIAEDIIQGKVELNQIEEDRKSTRLNSSHVAISYAVFCLKKKKQK